MLLFLNFDYFCTITVILRIFAHEILCYHFKNFMKINTKIQNAKITKYKNPTEYKNHYQKFYVIIFF